MPCELRDRAAERPASVRRVAIRGAAVDRCGAQVGRPASARRIGRQRRLAPGSATRLAAQREPLAAVHRRRRAGAPARPPAPRRRRPRPGPRRRERVLHRMPHRLVHLAAVAEAHLDLGRVHVDVDARRVDLEVQHVDRLALRRAARPRRRCAHGVREHLVAHVAAVDVGELLVGARARRIRHAGAARHAQRARAACASAHAVLRRTRRRARRPGAASRVAGAATARPACLRARSRSRRRAAPARGGAPPRCSARARWRRSSGTCAARAC